MVDFLWLDFQAWFFNWSGSSEYLFWLRVGLIFHLPPSCLLESVPCFQYWLPPVRNRHQVAATLRLSCLFRKFKSWNLLWRGGLPEWERPALSLGLMDILRTKAWQTVLARGGWLLHLLNPKCGVHHHLPWWTSACLFHVHVLFRCHMCGSYATGTVDWHVF